MPDDVLSLPGAVTPLHTGPEMYVEALVEPVGGNIRYTIDGQDPTDTLGALVYSGGSVVIEGSFRIKKAKLWPVGGTSITVNRRLEWTGNRGRKG